MNPLKERAIPILSGIIVSEFHVKIGPNAVLFTPNQLEKPSLNFVATKTIDYLEGITKLPDRVIIFEFPPMQKKGFVKFYNWDDPQLRGRTGIGSIAILYDEKDDPIFYKYRKDFEKPLQDFSETLIHLKKEQISKASLQKMMEVFEEQVLSLMNTLAKREFEEFGSEFPDLHESAKQPSRMAKIIVIGDPSVGKTSLILQYTDKAFHRSYIPTIGTNITEKNIQFKKDLIQLVIWDIAGQQKFNRIRHQFYKGAAAVILVFDLTDLSSFESISKWYNDLQSNLDDFSKVQLVLCGNKTDLTSERKVPKEQVEDFCQKYGTPYFEISSLTGQNVEETFQTVVKLILKNYWE
ncbi:MAG: small GTP-binding protein [Promethearchaeota archaeon CR_4]|nr:MAG: small GTP-binding protein [Candidatus Lokiarchaeota archaeon CR_4]